MDDMIFRVLKMKQENEQALEELARERSGLTVEQYIAKLAKTAHREER
jgi:hypothetical protein